MRLGTEVHREHRGKVTGANGTAAHPLPYLPLIAPEPPKLSLYGQELSAIEASGIYSNYGPVNTAFEQEMIEAIFGAGECVTVCNATIGLMLAIREVLAETPDGTRRYALLPSFTFAATAQAAMWCGLTPLLCDIDPNTWMPNAAMEEALLERYAGEIAVVIPYATFGNNLDLARYQRLSVRFRVPIVVDAAASLGSLDASGKAFGADFPWPVVFSMHATKVFSVGEGGILYCRDKQRAARLRSMGSFGFSHERSATCLGLNAKLSEVSALTGRLQLRNFAAQVETRELLAQAYAANFGEEFMLQEQHGQRQTRAFFPVLLPRDLTPTRAAVLRSLLELGVGAGCYFSPHLAEQPFFQRRARFDALPVTDEVASRVVSLPLTTSMNIAQVSYVVRAFRSVCDHVRRAVPSGLEGATERGEELQSYVEQTQAA